VAATLPDVAATASGASSAPAPAASPAPPDPLIGKEVGGYRILARLGRGGMSTVYKADQVSLTRTVALKIPHEDLVRDDRFRARFELEARTLARLDHPGIVRVYDVGTDQGLWYIAMEYVEGTTLGRFLARKGTVSPAAGVSVLKQCLAALARAHREKIVHRDIKPDNILIMRGGKTKITDFGLAKSLETASTLSLTGTILGTPLYMSPEQADGQPVDARSDLYSLGATFYHALTGRPPFEGATPVTIVLKHCKETPVPAHQVNAVVPEGLSTILSRMLAKRTDDRYADADAVLAEIAAWEQGKMPVPLPTPAEAGAPPWRRKPVVVAASAAAVVLVASVAIAAFGRRDATPAKSPAPPIEIARATVDKPPVAETATPPPTGAPVHAPPHPGPPETRPQPPPPPPAFLTPEEIEEAMAEPPARPPDGGPRRFAGGRDPLPPPDGMRPGRPDRADAVAAVLRSIPREPEAGAREAIRIARDSLARNEPMVAVMALRTTRRLFASHIDSRPELKAEYDKLTQEAVAKLPPGVRRPPDDLRGRMGRVPGFEGRPQNGEGSPQ
jgi:predicted Ser/Thr protein kinase